MDNDDATIGKILSRRQVVSMLGAGSLAAFVGATGLGQQGRRGPGGSDGQSRNKPSTVGPAKLVGNVGCVLVSPALTEGPFFVDEKLTRSDIRSDPGTKKISEGVELKLVVNLVSVGKNCAAIQNAVVDIWHCDAKGYYSDVEENGTKGNKFLRGNQVTDEHGQATFTTIYPGWYRGRAVHIHFKIRLNYEGKNYEFTSQLFFDEHVTTEVHKRTDYSPTQTRDVMNSQDGIYLEGGSKLILALKKSEKGYVGTFDVGMIVG